MLTTSGMHAPSPARLLTSSSAPLCHTPASVVGNTPVQWIDDLSGLSSRGFWAKLEGFNPGGMKDRPALHMIAKARERGELAPGGAVVESTSGTLGLGLALAGIVYGHPVTLVTDPGMEPIVQQMLQAHGARVDLVPSSHPVGGWQQARCDRVTQLLADTPGAYCPDQYQNPDNVAGYESLALELVAQLGRIDVLVCSVGTGGHSAGVSRVLREYFPDLRLVGVDTVGSTIFGQPARPRLMRGLGSSIHPRNVDYAAFDEVHWVNACESVWACRRLATHHHATGGWSVGAVAVVSSWLARTNDPDVRIAAVFPDGPQRYFDTIYNDTYCAANELTVRPPAMEPEEIVLASDREVTGWTRCRTVTDPAGGRA
ncbi:PLP-dependent cysteine synthase family protein [Lentzea sp. BCCO 10_0798]|uniref:PLP-dependent cysteine synthase family protein n=1 Tax=Lentzea kristufekii TaxID=3095430 RepID=A0ABU4TZF4_9PSEU|nr:PLP-dependent cysteine synthase family protein [Lentzea sp. BCCO 10_0798]MDX8053690.1 PLP-dependent cysteine synthase family protein [Lentzea sp. BCCO 10_0798]